MLVIPAIDLRGGNCVRLFQGDYSQETVYHGDPVTVARQFEVEGASLIHIVDLDGARTGEPANMDAVKAVAKAVGVPIQFGGGIRNLETAKRALDAGVHRVVVGSRIVQSPEFAEAIFAALGESAAAGIDAREGRVAVSGWTETSDIAAEGLARRMEALGARRFVVTDISRDGALSGPNVEFFSRMAKSVSGHVIASGGFSNLADFRSLSDAGLGNLEGIIVGRALYEGLFSLAEANQSARLAFEKRPIGPTIPL